MAADFADDGMFLVDLWPVADPMLVVFTTEAAVKVCQKLNLPKVKKNETMVRPITGGLSLLSMNGEEWKTWRGLFNPGFSQSLIMDQVPQIVDSASRFCERLKNCAGKGVIRLDELTTELTFEVILKVSL
jgi:cytochrome P450